MIYYDDIVVGSSLGALLYAFKNNYPVFFAQNQRPSKFEYFSTRHEPLFLELPGSTRSLTTFDGVKLIGQPKELLWERIFFLLSLNGKAPLSNLCSHIRYDGERVVCSNEYSKIMEFQFGHCVYFGDETTSGFTQKTDLDEEAYICYDHIAFNSGGKHEIDYIHTGDDFVSEIWFYPSDRIDGNTPVRDACAVSKLNKQQLLDFDYSETMARFKVLKTMKDKGMRGKLNGYTEKGTPRHYDFRTTGIRREVRRQPNKGRPTAANIKITETSEEALLKSIQNLVVPYDRFLERLNVGSS